MISVLSDRYALQEGEGIEARRPHAVWSALESILDHGWEELLRGKNTRRPFPLRGLRVLPVHEIFHRFPVFRGLGQKRQL